MNYDRIFESFLESVQKRGTYATPGEIREATQDMLKIIKENKDATPEEMVDLAIKDIRDEILNIKENYPIPGYTLGIHVGNINVKLFGGDIDSMKREMSDQALFDIASMTKFYTEVIAYNLMKEGVFEYDDKVQDLDPRFENVEELTIGDVLSFAVSFQTDGRIEENKKIDEALACLYTMKVTQVGEYNYNDMGMMLVKEVMESVTGKTHQDLMNEYIIDKLGLTDTHLVIPKKKIELLTGSANAKLGKVNDPKALAVGGYSGHAGVFASSDDLIKLGQGVRDNTILDERGLKDASTKGIKANRGIMGNTYTSHPKGIDMTYVDKLSSKSNFAIQGSTRTQMNIGPDSISTILLNPACMSIEQAKEEEAKINEQRRLKGQTPLSLVKHFSFNHNGLVEYDLIDARQMVPSAKTVEPLTTQNAKLTLKLGLLNEVIKEYDKNYDKEIDVRRKL